MARNRAIGASLCLVALCAAPVRAQDVPARPADARAQDGPDTSAGSVITDITTIDPETFEAIAARLPDGRAPRIDGQLDDEEWALAPAQGRFIQREPAFGWVSTERTEFRILYDDTTLYFGIWAYDHQPELIRASEMKRDSGLRKGDQIKIVIDTFHDHRNAFYFSTNPLGALKDAQSVEEGRTINYDWNAVWENRTSVDEQGWYVEIAIPMSQLRFQGGPGSTVWGLNICRIIIRKNEETYWVPFPREWQSLGFARMSGAGQLTGLRDLEPRRRVELVPFVAPRVSRNYDAGTPLDTDAGFGMDLKVGLTSTFNADLTYRTDFAQVEADQEVVNLSRFSLYFPEKRQFFTEGAGIFDYGRSTGGLMGPGLLPLFYSRRIGLDAGREVPILAGARVTGRTGAFTVGAMNIETDATSFVSGDTEVDVPRANYTVVRVKRDVLSSSTIGAIVLNRTGGRGADFNRAVGLDGVFTLGSSLDVTLLGAKTFSPGSTGRDWAAAVNVGWKNDRFDFDTTYLDIAERFNAEMGFIQRTDVRNSKVTAAWTPRPGWRGVRQLRISGSASYFENHAGRVESRNQGLDLTVSGSDTSSLRLSLDRNYDYLPFDWTTGGGMLATGGYTWHSVRASYTSSQSRAVSGSVSVDTGGYYNGTRRSYRTGLNLQPRDTLLVELNYTRNRVALPLTPPYVTNVAGTRVSYSFSPDLFVKSFVQYNDASRTATFNLLFWYIYRPGSDLYVVYDQGWETDLPGPRDLRVRGRSLSVKLTYWLSR